jgi:hypothetical protein
MCGLLAVEYEKKRRKGQKENRTKKKEIESGD